ncbi:hypothetical protein [Marinobacter sp. KMM 10035]|uniref:hypothetical protein n=1 Tax=Marinobacter sp. KMM 10035 TaxID=3134034 RepID=UPI00397CB376
MTKADELLGQAYEHLNISGLCDSDKYKKIEDIVSYLDRLNAKSKIPPGTTGTISERLCKLGLTEVPEIQIRPFGKAWQWVGDILLPGHPYDIAVSIKSFKAKERLIASGTGSILTPTLGWGLFDDPGEWGLERCNSYLYRGFLAIYMPRNLLNQLGSEQREIKNFNGTRLLRDLQKFPSDVQSAMSPQKQLPH